MTAITRRRWAVAASTAVTVLGALTDSTLIQRVAKPLIVPALILGLDPVRDRVLLGGLVAATVGDVLLIDPDDDSALRRGATAFAVMQASYSYLLLRKGARLTVLASLPRYSGWIAATILLAKRQPAVAPTLGAYGAVLATTSALSADPYLHAGSRRLELGGVLFTLSDAMIVGRRLFLSNEMHRRVAEAAILSSYAAAQVLLVEGLTSRKK